MGYKLDVDKSRKIAKEMMDNAKGKGYEMGEFYCAINLVNSALRKAQPELKRMNPVINDIKKNTIINEDGTSNKVD